MEHHSTTRLLNCVKTGAKSGSIRTTLSNTSPCIWKRTQASIPCNSHLSTRPLKMLWLAKPWAFWHRVWPNVELAPKVSLIPLHLKHRLSLLTKVKIKAKLRVTRERTCSWASLRKLTTATDNCCLSLCVDALAYSLGCYSTLTFTMHHQGISPWGTHVATVWISTSLEKRKPWKRGFWLRFVSVERSTMTVNT